MPGVFCKSCANQRLAPTGQVADQLASARSSIIARRKRAASPPVAARWSKVTDSGITLCASTPPITLGAAGERYFQEVARDQASADFTDAQLDRLTRGLGADILLSALGDKIETYIARRRACRARHKKTRVANATVNREIELLRRIAARRPTYLLSNTNQLHYDYIRRNFDFTRVVRAAVCLVRARSDCRAGSSGCARPRPRASR